MAIPEDRRAEFAFRIAKLANHVEEMGAGAVAVILLTLAGAVAERQEESLAATVRAWVEDQLAAQDRRN